MRKGPVLLLLSIVSAQRAALVDRYLLPLHTKGRYIVNVNNERVKWACINWAGAYSKPAVVGGLEVQDLAKVAGRIRELGFNCVRLCYSTENHLSNPLVKDEDVAANPDLKGKRFLYVFQRTVEALTKEGLMVILNNHISKSGWCCNVKQDEGFWYTDLYPERFWIESIVGMTTLFRNNSLVVAFDIRNEPHDIPGRQMTWGTDDAADWKAAAERAGNAVLAANPNLLIVVSALCFCMDLRPVKQYPIQFSVANRLVYETHNYIEFQVATLASNNFFSWAQVNERATWALVVLAALDLLCMWAWYRIGKPWPRKSTLLALVAGWGSFFTAVFAGVSFFGFYFYSMYCSYVAHNYFLPWGIILTVCCLLLLLLGAWAACIGLRIQTSDNCGVVPEVCEDICVGNSDDEKSLSELSDVDPLFRAHKDRIPGFAREPGFDSLSIAQEYCLGRKRHLPPPPLPPIWDCGMLLFLQIFMFLAVCTLLAIVLVVFSHLADTFWYMRFVFDTKWGFALAEGFPYTAPVWMGEFGQQVRGSYWLNVLRYLAERDVDFAYWPLNGKKYSEGYFSSSGGFVYWDQPRWEDESFGLLMNDSWSVRHTWKLLDIQALMDSPVKWTPEDYPCVRQKLGSACGY